MRKPFISPGPHVGTPIYPETSFLRSPRDPDVNARAHIKHEDASFNMIAMRLRMNAIESHVQRLRIRPGAGTAAGGTLNFVGEYDPNRSYSAGQIVIISMGSNAGTYCYINTTPSAGSAPYAGGGYWVQLPQGQLGLWM
jgi:hypothetical protein